MLGLIASHGGIISKSLMHGPKYNHNMLNYRYIGYHSPHRNMRLEMVWVPYGGADLNIQWGDRTTRLTMPKQQTSFWSIVVLSIDAFTGDLQSLSGVRFIKWQNPRRNDTSKIGLRSTYVHWQ